jgi:phytoene dehydrogenase-like protein
MAVSPPTPRPTGQIRPIQRLLCSPDYSTSSDDRGDLVPNPWEGTSSDEETEEFAPALGTGMRRVLSGAGAEFDAATTELLQSRLDEFDAVRTRGEVESRSVHLGGPPPR